MDINKVELYSLRRQIGVVPRIRCCSTARSKTTC